MNPLQLTSGVWPTMVTPFDEKGDIDWYALEKMVEWYISHGVAGLFAVCQSSEMFFLSLKERVELAAAVRRMARGRVQVVASGHVSDAREDQLDEIRAIAATGVDAVVLITNRLARQDQDDGVWKASARMILDASPDTVFGLYECPYPYKRLLNPHLLAWCEQTGRFAFLKDTCCDVGQIRAKLEAVKGTSLKVYNANSATLLETLDMGVAGFSGVMANMHPELYVWLCNNWQNAPDMARQVQEFLGVTSVAISGMYPVDAKYYMQLEGLPLTLNTRVKPAASFTALMAKAVEQIRGLTIDFEKRLFG
jgi:4-hydroxy-tetrahydrodipicolinate synthase